MLPGSCLEGGLWDLSHLMSWIITWPTKAVGTPEGSACRPLRQEGEEENGVQTTFQVLCNLLPAISLAFLALVLGGSLLQLYLI